MISLIAALCPSLAAAQTGRIERLTHGDTTIVRATGNGLWGAPHDAIEVTRIGGKSRETTFGDLGPLHALPNGGVLVFDLEALDGPALRMFDRDGKFVRNIGRRGNGPGEFLGNGTDEISVAPNGSFVLRRVDGIVNRYRADGAFINAFRFDVGGGGRLDVYPGPSATTYVRGGARPNTDMAEIAVHRYDTAGTKLDSLLAPSYLTKPHVSSFDPLAWWVPLPDGRVLATRSDQLGFLIRSGPGLMTLLLANVVADGPLFLLEERRERQAAADLSHDHDVQRGVSRSLTIVPERKLLLSRPDAELPVGGRVWVRRSATGVKVEPHEVGSARMADGTLKHLIASYSEPVVLAGFRLDGTYLGDVRFPLGTSVWAGSIIGDVAWATASGSDGTPYLVKYRLH